MGQKCLRCRRLRGAPIEHQEDGPFQFQPADVQRHKVARLDFLPHGETGEDRHAQGIGRVREVEVGRDGAIYVITDEENGQLIRITPQG